MPFLQQKQELHEKVFSDIMVTIQDQSELVEKMVAASFLAEKTKKKLLAVLPGTFKTIDEGLIKKYSE